VGPLSSQPRETTDVSEQRNRLRSVVPTPLMYVRRSVVVGLDFVVMSVYVAN
jgi:hypothetical protein